MYVFNVRSVSQFFVYILLCTICACYVRLFNVSVLCAFSSLLTFTSVLYAVGCGKRRRRASALSKCLRGSSTDASEQARQIHLGAVEEADLRCCRVAQP